jgi:hypothetical protein
MSEQDIFTADDLGAGLRAAEMDPEFDFRVPVGRLVALRPFGYKSVNINGVAVNTCEAYCVSVEEDGSYDDLGLRDVNWTPVLRELDKATDESPWIVGTVVHPGRSYFLQPPTPAEMKLAQRAIAALLRDRQAAPTE